jgi:two-component system, chemotaxis family, protein-glutamate methylesterase/glutaminase
MDCRLDRNHGLTRGAKPVRVLIIDDSALVRRILQDALSKEPGIEVAGTAPDPFVAREKILSLEPDVLTLDLEMPRMDGLSFLKRLMRYRPLPVIVISSLGQAGSATALEALRWGAVDVVPKPSGPNSVATLEGLLAEKIRAAAVAKLPEIKASTLGALATATSPNATASNANQSNPGLYTQQANKRKLLVIGSSTGGPPALETVLEHFGADCPPILIAQHIPAGFSRSFAERLDRHLPMRVREAQHGDAVEPGTVLIAPGNFHLLLESGPGGWRVAVKDGPQVRYQRPSVDVLFHSVARVAGKDCVAAILTGMGNDGAEGLLAIRKLGGWTIAQDEASCTVYGMPREAVLLGAAREVVTLRRMAERMDAALKRHAREEAATA